MLPARPTPEVGVEQVPETAAAVVRSRAARWLGRVGRVLIGAGVLMLLFVAYQLWGTGIVEARAQDDLTAEFEQLVAEPAGPPESDRTDGVDQAVIGSPERADPTPPPGVWAEPVEPGSALARIRIPAIDVDKVVIEGVSRADLRQGPGHYPGTPLPGQPGNAVIAGHRTTYGAPFFRLDELVEGDEILIDTPTGEVRYLVIGTEIVAPSQVEVLDGFGDNRLTLTTCNPRYSAAQRLIVTAVVDPAQEDTIELAAASSEPRTPPDPVQLQSIDDTAEPAPSTVPVVAWGLAAAAVAVFLWALGRWWRRWPVYLLGAPAFLVVLFVFFEHLNRLLPPSV